MNEDGKLDNVYIPEGLDSGWLVSYELKSRWTLKIGTSEYWLPKLHKKPDIFFHDSDHSYKNMKRELEWAKRHIKKGGIIIADDTSRNSAWKEVVANDPAFRRLSSPISSAVYSGPPPA